MKSDGMIELPGISEQIVFFEKFLVAVEAGKGVAFTQTGVGLELEVCEEDSLNDRERQQHIKLIRRTLVILRESEGCLVATKTGPRLFEFWVACNLHGGLPPHRWTSWGALYRPEPKLHAAEEFGLAPIDISTSSN